MARIVGVDLPRDKRIEIGLTYIYGIGLTTSRKILEECGKLNPAVLGTLDGSKAVAYANVMLITAENAFFLTMFKDKENARTLGDAIQHVMGKRYAIRARCSQAAAQPRPIEDMLKQAKNSGIPTTAV